MDTNYGKNSSMHVQNKGGQNRYGMIKFNLSSIPINATIESANLSLFLNTSSTNQDINFYHILQDWNEDDVKWGNWNPSGNYSSPANISGTLSSGSVARYNWSAVTDVQYFYNNSNKNYGWLIEVKNNQFAEFDSKEAVNASRRPILYVTYSE